MKLSGARALDFCAKPKAGPRIALLFGQDGGMVSSAASELAKAWAPDIDPANVIRLTDEDLRKDEARLTDELVALSMFGGDRLVRLRMERETLAARVTDILAQTDAGDLKPEAWLIVEGGDLGKSSKLRSAFEASDGAMALHLFPDDEQTVADFVASRLKAARIEIEPDAMAAFASELPGDRRLAQSEVEKLELYADGLGRAVTKDDIARIISAEQPRGADDAADAAIAGDANATTVAVNRFLEAGGSPISAMRTLHFRMMRVSDAIASNASTGMRLRPPIFDRDWPAFSRTLCDWSPAMVQRAFARLYEAERDCKQAGAPTEAILGTLLLRIARRAL
ncbi:MAG: DNA polymerase III subunit delta [Hyphomonadaceae bacterium]